MKLNGNLRKYGIFSSIAGGILAVLVFSMALVFFTPLGQLPFIMDWEGSSLIEGTAATYSIENDIETSFSNYDPQTLSYEPKITPVEIQSNLTNVDMQGLTLPAEIIQKLEQHGFALVDEGYEDIYEIYNTYEASEPPKFITTDLCLHAYHILRDISLRVLEETYFSDDFEIMLESLRDQQITLNDTVNKALVHDLLNKNIAYLSVMLYLLDNTTSIPQGIQDLVYLELEKIVAGQRAESAVFGYEEDFTQYKVQGHYTRNIRLSNYFKAMMYAGRMGFLLQSPSGDIEMGINHTRMALLLLSSFNATVNFETVWNTWDRIYQPTAFYVGSSDDLTALEYYQIWKKFDFPKGDQLANATLILEIINEAKTYRKPQINSMFVNEVQEAENVTQGFRLMGQRFIPDSYIFGSPRAANHLQKDNESFSGYSSQILRLREEFTNLTDYDWTQNLYWLWLYSLFPLLRPATSGYPSFMLSDAWTDKALMTTMGSWVELHHNTILYAKKSYPHDRGFFNIKKGYVEPYPELDARLSSLVHLMKNGLEERGLVIEGFSYKLDQMAAVFNRLVEISIKELENKNLSQDEISFINNLGREIAGIASFQNPEDEPWVNETDDRTAGIVDIHTDPISGKVLEVATGNPFVIYVVVEDPMGKLRLTRGGTFSYYEFKYSTTDRLSDEEWHEILDTNPPSLPEWIQKSIPILNNENNISLIVTAFYVDVKKRRERRRRNISLQL
jgi:hypothetical protein